MPRDFNTLYKNIKDISQNCGFGNYYSLLSKEGLCFGLVFIWGQSILYGKMFHFINNLNYLTDDYQEEFLLSKHINNSLKELRSINPQKYSINLQSRKYTDILSFLDALLLYQNPENIPIAKESPFPKSQSHKASQFVLPKTLLKEEVVPEPLVPIFEFPFCGAEKDFKNFLDEWIIKALNKMAEIKYFIVLNPLDHTIGITFNNNKINIYNPVNDTLYKNIEKDYSEAANKIFNLLGSNEINFFNIAIYIAPINKASFQCLSKQEEIKYQLTKTLNQEINRTLRTTYTNNYSENKKAMDLLSIFNSRYIRTNNFQKIMHFFYGNVTSNICSETISKIYYDFPDNMFAYLYAYSFSYLKKAIYNDSFHLKKTKLFFISCQRGYTEIVTMLIMQQGIDANKVSEHGFTPLFIACQYGYLEIAETLIKYGANVNAINKNENGFTALFIASQFGHSEIVEMLIKKGANINFPKNDGMTPLMVACRFERLKTIEILIEKSTNINFPRNDGMTPLMIAAEHKKDNTIKLLLAKKAKRNIENYQDKNKTAYDYYKCDNDDSFDDDFNDVDNKIKQLLQPHLDYC